MLTKGADLNHTNNNEENCFYLAVKHGNQDLLNLIVDELMVNISQSDVATKWRTHHLHLAVWFYPDQLALIDKIINLNVNYLVEQDINRQTALFAATMSGNEKVVELLIKRGSNIQHVDNEGKNCLKYAIERNDETVKNLLVKHSTLLVDRPVESIIKKMSDLNLVKQVDNTTVNNLNEKLTDLERDKRHLQDQIDRNTETICSLEKKNEIIQFYLGQILISGNSDGSVKFWNVRTGDLLKTIEAFDSDKIRCFELTTDGKLIVSSDNWSIRMFDLLTCKCVMTLDGHTESVYVLKILKGGRQLASGSADKSIKIWNLDSGLCVRTLNEHTNSVVDMQLTDTGLMLSCSYDSFIKIWSADDDKSKLTIFHGISQLKVIRILNENEVISAGDDKKIKFWNIHTGACMNVIDLGVFFISKPFNLSCLLTSTNSNELIFSVNNQIVVYNLTENRLVCKLNDPDHNNNDELTNKHSIMKIAFLQNGHIVGCSSDRTIKIWDLETGFIVKKILNDRGILTLKLL